MVLVFERIKDILMFCKLFDFKFKTNFTLNFTSNTYSLRTQLWCQVAHLCTPGPCGEHGKREMFNATASVCPFQIGFKGSRCSDFGPVENSAYFDGESWIQLSKELMPHQPPKTSKRWSSNFDRSKKTEWFCGRINHLELSATMLIAWR